MAGVIIIVGELDGQTMGMVLYSLALGAVLVASAPWWGWRMLRGGRYRAGLRGRLGAVPDALRAVVAGKRVVWVHAVSMGEVLASERLVGELAEALGAGWVVVVSTTTETGQKVAGERFGEARVFYWPLDFEFAVRRYLRVLRPELLVLLEGEVWPRMLHECGRVGVPVAVVNARVSDRSFRRAMRWPAAWRWMATGVSVWLAQGEETAGRLRALGLEPGKVRVVGNLKYDLRVAGASRAVEALRALVAGRRVVVAGSTLAGEERLLLEGWATVLAEEPEAVLVLAPRRPERFGEVAEMVGRMGFDGVKVSGLRDGGAAGVDPLGLGRFVVVLDTVGDLAAVYGLAAVAFVGGSLVAKGGHNPLEAARFGVPVVMGPHYENFREMVDGMRAAKAIRIARHNVGTALLEELEGGSAMGERGRVFFEAQAGATGRTVAALLGLIHG